jgi:hypothetical protein
MQFSVRLLWVCLFLTALISFLAGCGDSSHSSAPQQHLYVGNNATPGEVLQFALPLTNNSTSTATLANSATNNIVGLGVDSSGNLATGDSAGHLVIYNAPITSSSKAAASFNNGTETNSGQLVFDGAGNLFTTSSAVHVNIFKPPLSSSSVPNTTETIGGMDFASGAAFDGSGSLFVSNGGANSRLFFFPPAGPGANQPVANARYRQLGISNNQVFVANMTGTTGQIDVYSLPLGFNSVPAFSMTNVNVPTTVAFDSGGNLYVGNAGDRTIRVFHPPFAAGSTPSLTLTLSAPFDIESLAIGK